MSKKSRLAVTVAGVALAAMSNAQNFTLNGSAGTIDYTVESVGGANAGGPVFAGYKLITPGHNFKGTGAVQAGIASTAGSLAAAAPGSPLSQPSARLRRRIRQSGH